MPCREWLHGIAALRALRKQLPLVGHLEGTVSWADVVLWLEPQSNSVPGSQVAQ